MAAAASQSLLLHPFWRGDVCEFYSFPFSRFLSSAEEEGEDWGGGSYRDRMAEQVLAPGTSGGSAFALHSCLLAGL